ncbi:MAG: hypothetical protein A3E51_05645 [Burkholderiales bacterium RIFCSPHIGHO2_12_FULL_67_38]|nr:MAG: hypothetical protein A3I64_16755 [Burkholderiales bacterium RIFCSPLOWO2_02_FULL_67_64]OGB35706.1 MAG: hypothetical protein A3E51_05645 [Burkholderiales bacterium RIFCSPHIGHO2_12_FULL_67_38]OGB88046.1 MAG: hypothetical protein A3G82_18685 [Burkholderiales bacterium RIFCSPLOWO2_12_FULL_67_210]
MSLIYQALKQTEQQAAPAQRSGRRWTGVAAPAPAPARRGWNPVPALWGVGIAAVAVLAGWVVSLALAAPHGPSAESTPVPAPAPVVPAARDGAGALSPAPLAPPAAGTARVVWPDAALPDAALPKADLPLPTASPRLALARSLSVPAGSGAVSAPPVAAPAAPAQNTQNVQDTRPPAEPATGKKGAADSPRAPASAPVSQPTPDELPALFDALNQALAGHEVDTARRQLQAIQARLPESSVARLRAEAWFAHQTDDLDGAQRLYRRLLDKLSGDEHASLNLAAIEKKRQRFDQAKDVLAKSLRQNPNSAVLRTAVDQLARSETTP